ncbi:hypothetical protein EG329_002211 [Mollisiaceae sp. DMI_Dod_QoI]|nr:hypothetical protein EG329_002211 [Helotiales sp. DMI_Dod_QoI]
MDPKKMRALLELGWRRKGAAKVMEAPIQKDTNKEDDTEERPTAENLHNLDNQDLTSDHFTSIRLGLSKCRAKHAKCNKTRGLYLPSRLIDVGSSHQDPRLVLREEVEDRSYATLSHRWGVAKHITTTTASLPDHRDSIPMDSLSDVFKRAVLITRELGLRYLWIDSLCILQDSALDWEQESAEMGSIFASSTITIGNIGPYDGLGQRERYDPYDGLGQTRKYNPFDLSVGSGSINLVYRKYRDLGCDTGQLEGRAWIAQERICASATLYCGGTRSWWECRTWLKTIGSLKFDSGDYEDGPETHWPVKFRPIIHFIANALTSERQTGPSTAQNQKAGSDLLSDTTSRHSATRTWMEVVEYYSHQELTFGTDRLPALSGLAKIFHKVIDDRYLAGHWLSQLHYSLLWHVPPGGYSLSRPEASSFLAPSWSWASHLFPVAHMQWERLAVNKCYLEVLDHQVKTADSNPFGRITKDSQPSLRLRGPLVQAKLVLREKSGFYSLQVGDDVVQWPRFDPSFHFESQRKRMLGDVSLLLALRGNQSNIAVALILVRLQEDAQSGFYHRIGLVDWDSERGRKDPFTTDTAVVDISLI